MRFCGQFDLPVWAWSWAYDSPPKTYRKIILISGRKIMCKCQVQKKKTPDTSGVLVRETGLEIGENSSYHRIMCNLEQWWTQIVNTVKSCKTSYNPDWGNGWGKNWKPGMICWGMLKSELQKALHNMKTALGHYLRHCTRKEHYFHLQGNLDQKKPLPLRATSYCFSN